MLRSLVGSFLFGTGLPVLTVASLCTAGVLAELFPTEAWEDIADLLVVTLTVGTFGVGLGLWMRA